MKDLMQKRYKVIADYPGSPFEVGKILPLDDKGEYAYYEHDGRYTMSETDMQQYPNLFRKLEWWEERLPEEMPEYVKFIDSTRILGFPKTPEISPIDPV